ncbi:hypothetical protein [Enhygromyxa salina]|uniref:hypothetical protein n=1 Tax=Enhygromyxa salina TaxID=215803 RepID=UPI0011BACF21|nr:hypothetical protein [Enhygromyxa salina]
MPAVAPAVSVPHDPRLRATARKLTIAAWVALAVAVVLSKLGISWLFAPSNPAGELVNQLLWTPPKRFLIGVAVIAGLAPLLAGGWLRAPASVAIERVRRRRVIGLVGLFGLTLMAALTSFDMALLRRAIELGVAREHWDFGCVWPSGDYQAAFVGSGQLAVVLRIQAAVVDTLARSPRAGRGSWRLWRVGLACVLAACAAAPFAWLGIEDHVASQYPRTWLLPSVAYIVAFGVFELCARLGLLGRAGAQRRRSQASKPKPSSPTSAPPRQRGHTRPRLTPDPAALALGHRALARARRWLWLSGLVGSGAVIVLINLSAIHLAESFDRRGGAVLPAMLLICVGLLAWVVFQASLPSPAPPRTRPRLASAGLERVVELIEQAIAQLERGHDQPFEVTYYDFTARFEALTPDELERLATLGLDSTRLRSLPATWVDATQSFDPELRRGIHRELMQIQATIIGRPSADPYRADLGACSLVDSIGLGWLRRGQARDGELNQAHGLRNWAIFAAVLGWVAITTGVGLATTSVPLKLCMPGVGDCQLALPWLEWDLVGAALLTLAPIVAWVIGLAHRSVAARCFEFALPCPANDAPAAPPYSVAFNTTYLQLSCKRTSWFLASIAGCQLLLAAVPLLTAVSAASDSLLEDALGGPGVCVLLGALVGFALVCVPLIRHGHRRLCAHIWLARLDRRNTNNDEDISAMVAAMVGHRIRLVTSSPPPRDAIEALIACVAAAPLPVQDRVATLERLELARARGASLTPEELLELEAELWVCELWVAESGAC